MTTAPADRVLVFQPLVSEHADMDVRLIGLSMWLARRIANLGVETTLATIPPPEGETGVSAITPSDDQIHQIMTGTASRWALFTSFAVLHNHPQLALARLFERRPEPPLLGCTRMKFDGDNDHLPAVAHGLLVAVAQLIGKVPPTAGWDELFGTAERDVANHYLLALGGHTLADQGRLGAHGDAVLCSMLIAIKHGLRPAILGLPVLVTALRSHGCATEQALATAVRSAVDAVATVPPEWQPMLLEVGIPTSRLEN